MEEIAALVIQLVVEVGLQLLGSIGIDIGLDCLVQRLTRDRGEKADEVSVGGDGWAWLVAFAVCGGVCGGLSLLVRPSLVLPTLALRVANLAAAPLVAGGLSYLIAAHVWLPHDGRPWHHFWRGFCFALTFGLVRFASAHG